MIEIRRGRRQDLVQARWRSQHVCGRRHNLTRTLDVVLHGAALPVRPLQRRSEVVMSVRHLIQIVHHFVRYDQLVFHHLALADFVQYDRLVGVQLRGVNRAF